MERTLSLKRTCSESVRTLRLSYRARLQMYHSLRMSRTDSSLPTILDSWDAQTSITSIAQMNVQVVPSSRERQDSLMTLTNVYHKHQIPSGVLLCMSTSIRCTWRRTLRLVCQSCQMCSTGSTSSSNPHWDLMANLLVIHLLLLRSHN